MGIVEHGADADEVVGAGPNGPAAALVVLGAGPRAQVYEATETIGGGACTRGAEVIAELVRRHRGGAAGHVPPTTSTARRELGVEPELGAVVRHNVLTRHAATVDEVRSGGRRGE